MNSLNDDDFLLLQKIEKGDSKAFESLYSKYKNGLLGYCISLVGDKMKAQDLFQDTWIKIAENAGSYQARNSFKSWAFSISRNHFINQISREKWEQKIDEQELDKIPSETSIDIDYFNKEKGQWLKNKILMLPEAQRIALVLFLIEELNHSEISVQMNISVNNVKVLLHRAKTFLENEFKRSQYG